MAVISYLSARKKLGITSEERLLLMVKKNDDGCWLTSDYKHGGFSFKTDSGKYLTGARFVMHLLHGEFDKRILVCHKCDNSSCVNPEHLYLGDHQTNANDRSIPQSVKLKTLKKGGSFPWWT